MQTSCLKLLQSELLLSDNPILSSKSLSQPPGVAHPKQSSHFVILILSAAGEDAPPPLFFFDCGPFDIDGGGRVLRDGNSCYVVYNGK
ncbi:hypothetical protein BDQ12DRAFT_691395 [Crucibulum laeve]|uniref:Uncharacterized protein n=1 Tax=Crucibulum laeve TaxID=68775 RepID=A0A5C3LWZ5_9AGAR|nr:hypothetical protein BDQ12DRAFT_691395 [Crucibulum laeve]